MTVSSTTRRNDYIATSGQTIFPYGFKIINEADIEVYQTADGASLSTTPLVLNTDYTVSNVGNSTGGNVTLTTGATLIDAIAIVGARALAQEADYTENDAFPADVTEDALDNGVILTLEQGEEFDRTVKLSRASSTTVPDLPDLVNSTTLTVNSSGKFEWSTSLPTGSASQINITDTNVTKDKLVSNLLGKNWEAAKDFLNLDATSNQADVIDTINELKGSAIASAATTDIWAATGNLVHITGTTGITSFGTASQAGAERTLIFDGVVTITHSASLDCPGGQDIVTKAGTRLIVRADTTTNAVITVWQDDALPNPYPDGYIDGFILSNGTDAVNDIDIAVGSCRAENAEFNIDLDSILVKQIDANWAVGSAAGGFPSGLTLTNDTWYHLFVIRRSDTGVVDAGYDTSLTATNLLTDASGYDAYRRVGSIYYGTATIVAFLQNGDEFIWDVPIQDQADAATSTTQVLKTLTVPLGLKVLAKFSYYMASAAGSREALLLDPDQTDTVPSSTVHTVRMGSSAAFTFQQEVRTNTSSQIGERSAGTFTRQIMTKGWIDTRGKS
jgi:hypothetical protein